MSQPCWVFVTSRPVFVDTRCFVEIPNWVQADWAHPHEAANYPRDFLMPAPSTSFGEGGHAHGTSLRCSIRDAKPNIASAGHLAKSIIHTHCDAILNAALEHSFLAHLDSGMGIGPG